MNCLGVQQRQQHHNSSSAAHEKMSYSIFGLLRSVGRRPSCDPRNLLSVLNEENWDARLVERFSLPLYGLPEQAAPLTKISAMPQRKHCLGSATPQRNIVFLISPTRAHACLISCSGRKKNIHSRCCLSTTNQPVRLFSMLFTRFVTSSEESRREDVGTRTRSKLPTTHGIHGIAWICVCHCLLCLGRAWN